MQNFSEWTKQDMVEVLSVAQRRATGRRLKRMSGRIQRSKKIKQKKLADRGTLQKRASRAAREKLTKKLTGGKGKSELTLAQRLAVGKKLAAKSNVIAAMARKLLPATVKAEKERLATFRASKD